ncbi:hypothetical protein DY023_05980 [Microbacterium bovistercoris]|uniref:Uncharacterized protein n=1 Tax=Microbacterium bovistercoris TaxID=2293570 RepID=A0A371NVM4_9MICO|nr:hypothetical protein [Microbacterium bovistercoris]REJ06643.1 hypothetical protein DY023_05980 [Microbacterium bovistercoris]
MTSAGHPSPTKRKVDPSVLLALAVIMIAALVLGVPALMNAFDRQWISEDVGTEDAVIALRLTAGEKSYLALLDADGTSRVARVDERGFQHSRLAWTQAGLSTGGPDAEYVLHDDGSTKVDLKGTTSASVTESQRLPAPGGFLVANGSARGNSLAFIDAEGGSAEEIDVSFSHAEFAACDDEVVMVEFGGQLGAVTPQTRDLHGQNVFDDLPTLFCDGDRVYGLGEISEDRSRPTQSLRTWDRATGARSTAELVYPRDVSAFEAYTPFEREGRLYWTADGDLWSVPLQGDHEGDLPSGTKKAVSSADLGPFVGDFLTASEDQGAYAQAGRCVIGVGVDDEAADLGVFTVDLETGEPRIALVADDIDLSSSRSMTVTALAVKPGWAPKGC